MKSGDKVICLDNKVHAGGQFYPPQLKIGEIYCITEVVVSLTLPIKIKNYWYFPTQFILYDQAKNIPKEDLRTAADLLNI